MPTSCGHKVGVCLKVGKVLGEGGGPAVDGVSETCLSMASDAEWAWAWASTGRRWLSALPAGSPGAGVGWGGQRWGRLRGREGREWCGLQGAGWTCRAQKSAFHSQSSGHFLGGRRTRFVRGLHGDCPAVMGMGLQGAEPVGAGGAARTACVWSSPFKAPLPCLPCLLAEGTTYRVRT